MSEKTEKKEKKLEPVTEKRSILYEIARVLAMILFHTFMPVKCIHREKLDREADELAEKSSRAEELKELERQETSVRVMLLERDAIRDRVDGGMDLLDAADEAAGCLLQQLKERFTGRILVAGLMVLGGAAGFAGIPAAFERKKSRLWLIAPVALCLGFAAAVEILCRLLGRGDSYSALGVTVFALIQLALVIPKKKKT